jgi:alpha-galactosidase
MDRSAKNTLFMRCAALCAISTSFFGAAVSQTHSTDANLKVDIDPAHGTWSIGGPDGTAINGAAIAVEVDHKWLKAADYPKPTIAHTTETGELGAADCWTVTYSGDSGKAKLILRLRAFSQHPFADLQLTVRNQTGHAIAIQDIRPISISAANGIDLGGPPAEDRVLSDSLSEDRPTMAIRDLADAPGGIHRAAGSQLIFNRKSGLSFFVGALTSDKFLSVFKAHILPTGGAAAIANYEADDNGTSEFTKEWSLRGAPPQDQIELSVSIAPGQELKSERLLLSLDSDYHRQLETYAHLIRDLHHARVSAPTPMGWWSWTAYYATLDEAKVLITAHWLAQHLKPLGYGFLHIDEGYAIGRGDYLTPDLKLFPNGMEPLEKKIAALGLTPAIWTAPFEVSNNSWVYKNHPEWLVKNGDGQPIRLPGADPPNHDRIYVLDATHPGAQGYLKTTYSTMAGKWGIRYIKLDFMEDSAIEGAHYKPNTSALEAQRIGLQVIRSAVGDKVWLDKDGSEMLNPVGLVDMGRISQDTGHDFKALKDTATGIAARYYMNRNYFISDPDAFMVTAGEGKNALSLDEAKVSIALSAVSGGMFEIGDKLPGLDSQPGRLALIENPVLIGMARGGRASIPVDLMTYAPEDGQPSIFFLKATGMQTDNILTVFNWTDTERVHSIELSSFGLISSSTYKVEDIWTGKELQTCSACTLPLDLAPHSVQMLKIEETSSHPGKAGANPKP